MVVTREGSRDKCLLVKSGGDEARARFMMEERTATFRHPRITSGDRSTYRETSSSVRIRTKELEISSHTISP
jgi:hypothetical protein